jgi:type I restriction enzyme S subunit
MRKKVCIGDLGTIVTGNTPPRNRPELYGNHTPFIKATDISESEKYTYNPEECYSEEGYNKYIKSLIPKGSTCVVTIGSIGKKMTMAHCDLFINQAMNAIIPNACFDSEYVYYAVKNVLGNIKTLDSGTASGRENVSKSAFSKMEIWVEEELPIQQRIATILSRYDSLIENYQKQIKLLEEAAQRLYKEWFIDLHFPGHENTKIVDGVPEGWEKKRLADVAELKAGGDKPDIVSDVRTEDCAIPIFSNGTTNEGLYGFTKVPEIMEHCVTISARGSVGYTVLRRTPFVPIVRLISVIPHNVYVGYIFYYLKSTTLDSNGAAQQQITIPMIRNKEITIPSKGILEIFESQTEPIFNQIDILKDQIRHLTEARDRLLPKLMNGEIEV